MRATQGDDGVMVQPNRPATLQVLQHEAGVAWQRDALAVCEEAPQPVQVLADFIVQSGGVRVLVVQLARELEALVRGVCQHRCLHEPLRREELKKALGVGLHRRCRRGHLLRNRQVGVQVEHESACGFGEGLMPVLACPHVPDFNPNVVIQLLDPCCKTWAPERSGIVEDLGDTGLRRDQFVVDLLQEGVGLLGFGGDPPCGVGSISDDALQVGRQLRGQATAATHQFASKELVRGRVHSDRLNVPQDVGLQMKVHCGVGPTLLSSWKVPDKSAERVDHVHGGLGDIRRGRPEHLSLAQNATVAVEAGDRNEPDEEPALTGVPHQGDHVGPPQEVLVLQSDRLVDAPEELVGAFSLPGVCKTGGRSVSLACGVPHVDEVLFGRDHATAIRLTHAFDDGCPVCSRLSMPLHRMRQVADAHVGLKLRGAEAEADTAVDSVIRRVEVDPPPIVAARRPHQGDLHVLLAPHPKVALLALCLRLGVAVSFSRALIVRRCAQRFWLQVSALLWWQPAQTLSGVLSGASSRWCFCGVAGSSIVCTGSSHRKGKWRRPAGAAARQCAAGDKHRVRACLWLLHACVRACIRPACVRMA